MSTSKFLGTPYWREIRNGLFVHNPKWEDTINRLPGLIDAKQTLTKLVSVEQLVSAGMKGSGSIGLKLVEVEPNWETLSGETLLVDGLFSVENLFLQWMYQFNLVDGIVSNFYTTPLPEWPLTFINIVEESLHTMTYIAALIYLYDELAFKAGISTDNFEYTETEVRGKVQALTSTLYSKCVEYGESFRRHGVQGLLPRLWDKAARYSQLSALGRNATYEPKLDSAKDLLGYCIIAWSLVQELDDEA